MKIILVLFLYITSSQCGVLKEGSDASWTLKESQLTRVNDAFVKGNITLINEILIDTTKDDNINNVTTESGGLAESSTTNNKITVTPGLHTWDIKYHVSESLAEVNRINSIVEATAKKTGRLLGKNCTTDDKITFICYFYIYVDEVPVDQDKPENVNTAANQTDVERSIVNNCDVKITIDGIEHCSIATTSEAFIGGCPVGTDRAPDNTCVEIIE